MISLVPSGGRAHVSNWVSQLYPTLALPTPSSVKENWDFPYEKGTELLKRIMEVEVFLILCLKLSNWELLPDFSSWLILRL